MFGVFKKSQGITTLRFSNFPRYGGFVTSENPKLRQPPYGTGVRPETQSIYLGCRDNYLAKLLGIKKPRAGHYVELEIKVGEPKKLDLPVAKKTRR